MMSSLIVAAALMGQAIPQNNPYGYYDYQIGPSGVMMTGNGWPPGYGLPYPFYGPYGQRDPFAAAQARQNLENSALTSQVLQEQLWMIQRQRNALQVQEQVRLAIEEDRQAIIAEMENRARLAKVAARREQDRRSRLTLQRQLQRPRKANPGR